ncbi:hypothetical protein KZZ07_21645 [Mameliella sp. CS4]|uniref:hypothetical protein n=1 Tax=Mameliella sp. CS4 TaxID=2862329 RepID=UPI001C5D2167|nr:hypothetical protein [Mameliella sp. CS4]MBW4985151.1 hypothetical protein [Mameliella sp. CS4]
MADWPLQVFLVTVLPGQQAEANGTSGGNAPCCEGNTRRQAARLPSPEIFRVKARKKYEFFFDNLRFATLRTASFE